MYVNGNLCMGNGSKYTRLEALRRRQGLDNSGTVGTSGSPISTATIVGGCISGGEHASLQLGGQGLREHDLADRRRALTKPTVDLANAYATAQPGPMNDCTTGSMPGGFDTDTTMNRSRAQFDLTPGSSYDCRYVDGSGTTVGQLTWNRGTSTLTVKASSSSTATSSAAGTPPTPGLATIYTSGTVTLPNNATFCGIAGCTSSWDTANNLILFVRGSSTDQYGVALGNNANVQAAAYAVNDVLLSQQRDAVGACGCPLGHDQQQHEPGRPDREAAAGRARHLRASCARSTGTWRG